MAVERVDIDLNKTVDEVWERPKNRPVRAKGLGFPGAAEASERVVNVPNDPRSTDYHLAVAQETARGQLANPQFKPIDPVATASALTQAQLADASNRPLNTTPQAQKTFSLSSIFTETARAERAASALTREQLANPNYRPASTYQDTMPMPLKEPTGSAVAASKVGMGIGRAQMGVAAAVHLAEGDVTGAITSTAQTAATSKVSEVAIKETAEFLARQGLKRSGFVVGAAATVAFGISAVFSKAARGEYAAAAIEGLTLAGEAIANTLPSGIGGEGVRTGANTLVSATLGPHYAPEKSDIQRGVGATIDAVQGINYRSMSRAELKEAIQNDDTLQKTVRLGSKDVPLTTALEDKTYRGAYIASLEGAQAKGHDLQAQITLLKAFDANMNAPAARAPAPTPYQPSPLIPAQIM